MNIDDLQRAYIKAQASKDGSESRGDKSHHAAKPVEPTLGDRIPADRKVRTYIGWDGREYENADFDA